MKNKFLKITILMGLMIGSIGFANKLAPERVKQIVLARVPNSSPSNIVAFKENDSTYSGEIQNNGKKYVFEVNASTGKILKWEAK